MSINLPTQPTGMQFEDAVSARVRSIGYFTEHRTIMDHEGREILELDVVASPASDEFLNRVLIDAKKDTAGFGDIFKVYGWRNFLKIPRGCIVHGTAMAAAEVAAFQEVCPKLEVYANHLDIAAPQDFAAIPVINVTASQELRQTVASVGWYQSIADRLALEEYHKTRKLNPEDTIFPRVRKYRRACQLAFFESDPFRRAAKLYTAFQEDPGIAGACVEWQAAKSGADAKVIWDKVRDSGDYIWIQHVMALETRARILIIKNGIEAALRAEFTGDNLESLWKSPDFLKLPGNFQNGFVSASKSTHRKKIPYILQLYVEIFDGFLIDQQDRAQIAELACVPVEVVAEALDLFDLFYPTANGWITTSKEVHMMKMIPAYVRGIGAFQRHDSRKLKNDYTGVAPSMFWLVGKWHNAAYKLLEAELIVKDKAK